MKVPVKTLETKPTMELIVLRVPGTRTLIQVTRELVERMMSGPNPMIWVKGIPEGFEFAGTMRVVVVEATVRERVRES